MQSKTKTIEIDDSGTGDLVGDAFIGFHVVETGKIIFRGIPVGFYNEENHKNRKSFEFILEMVKDGLEALNFNEETDKVQICRGSCFNLVREWFDEVGIKHEPAIVEGRLQDAVEGRLVEHLQKLGVNSPKLTKEAGFQRYFVLFNWVTRDFPEREKYVKTGFPMWNKKWRKIAMKQFYSYKNKKNRIGRKITRKQIKERANEILEVF
ncbi:MAG: hypothetical protein ACFFCM_19510 [Promethearchaeota archaeon]